MSKYNEISKSIIGKSSEEIIEQFDLSAREIAVMRFLFFNQLPKEDVVNFLYDKYPISKIDACKIINGLKKKGLIYSVSGLSGWVGINIKI